MTVLWDAEPKYHALGQEDLDALIDREVVRSKLSARRVSCLVLVVLLSVLSFLFLVGGQAVSTDDTRCTNPRLRQEWRALGQSDKDRYIAAVQCINSKPALLHDFGHIPDDFAWVHVEGSYTSTLLLRYAKLRVTEPAHYRPAFLLWHRYFIWLYEEKLRDQCGYVGSLPYWDWARDSQDPTHSPIWSNDTGFGGNGRDVDVSRNTGCVEDGPFAHFELQFINEKHEPHCLSRGFNFSGEKFAPEVVKELYALDRLTDFSEALEENSHDAIPNGIGGDFATFTAPGDPVWFLHHSNIDRLFWRWQMAHPDRRTFSSLSMESDVMRESLYAPMLMLGLASELPASSMIDCTSDKLCYAYT